MNNEINKLRKEKNEFEQRTRKNFICVENWCVEDGEEIDKITKKISEKNIELDKKLDKLVNNLNNLKVNIKKNLFFSFSFTDLKIEKIKNEKNLEYFKDIMNRYYNALGLLDDHCLLHAWFTNYKSSYDYLIELIFEEITEKNSNNCDKLLVFPDGNKYDNWIMSNWNAFYIRNSIHRMFYCENVELNEKLLDNIYEKLDELIPNLNSDRQSRMSKSKSDIKEYYKVYQIYYIIEVLKKKTSELKSEEWCVKLNIY